MQTNPEERIKYLSEILNKANIEYYIDDTNLGNYKITALNAVINN